DIDRSDVDLWMGTLSKSLASCGGYISGSKELVEYLKYYSPGFIFSCGITPSNTAAALAALKVLKSEPELIGKLQENSSLFLKLAQEAGFDTGSSQDTPIVPIMIKDSVTAMLLTRKLFDRGINVMPIVYPAVPEDMVRFRFFMSSLHTKEQIESTIDILKEEILRTK
ncbi:MAG: aminotransferase class I/II-fold pyridoxal phosphate-dependent enzyme, partial [Candidatus Saccharibacteria bacterium]